MYDDGIRIAARRLDTAAPQLDFGEAAAIFQHAPKYSVYLGDDQTAEFDVSNATRWFFRDSPRRGAPHLGRHALLSINKRLVA